MNTSYRAVRCLLLPFLIVMQLSWARAGFGVTVASYPFNGNSLASVDSDPNSLASDLIAGAGLSANAQFINYFGGPAYGVFSSHTPNSEALALSGDAYFSFTLTPSSETLQYGTFFFNLDCSANGIAGSYTPNIELRWSADNFGASLGTASTTINPGLQSSSGESFDLSSLPAQSGAVEFRLYVFDNQNEGNFTNVAIDNVTLDATAIPEPATSLALIAGFGVILAGNPWRKAAASRRCEPQD